MEEDKYRPQSGTYDGIADFVNRNGLGGVFRQAVKRGGQPLTVEDFLMREMETQGLILGLIGAMSRTQGREWAYGLDFETPVSPRFHFTIY